MAEPKRYQDDRGNYYWKYDEKEVVEEKVVIESPKETEKKDVDSALKNFKKSKSKKKK